MRKGCDLKLPSSAPAPDLRRFVPALQTFATVTVGKPGRQTPTVWMVDPGVIVDKLVLYTSAPKDSCLGPPESYRR
jgi:hypothetical protein